MLFTSNASTLSNGGRVVCVDQAFTYDQGAVAKADRGEYVRFEKHYRSLTEPHFSDVRSDIRHDVRRIPSASIILELSTPKISHGPI